MEVIIMSDSEQVTPRKRRVSRNGYEVSDEMLRSVTPRKRRVSRNLWQVLIIQFLEVTPRKRRVSRNLAGFE